MRALVTGCAGFIGSHLIESLLNDGVRVLGIYCFNDNYGRRQKLHNLERAPEWARSSSCPSTSPCRSPGPGRRVRRRVPPRDGARGPAVGSVRTLLAQQRARHATSTRRNQGAARPASVCASSSSVYGDAPAATHRRRHGCCTLLAYGMTKLSDEQVCRLYRANFGVDAVVLGFCGPVSARHGLPNLLRCRARRPTFEVFGNQTRDFTFVGRRRDRDAGSRQGERIRRIARGRRSRVSVDHALWLLAQFASHPLHVPRSAWGRA
jgi:hypothetical protein